MEDGSQHNLPSSSFSLFPLQSPLTSSQHLNNRSNNETNNATWVSNASFDVSLLPIANSLATPKLPIEIEENALDLDEDIRKEEPSYPILGSSSSEDEEEQEFEVRENQRKRKRPKLEKNKKKKKKDKPRERDKSSKGTLLAGERSVSKSGKDYHFDTRGDRDNLEFGSLYRMDVARYRLHHLTEESILADHGSSYKGNQRITVFNPEGDSISLDDKGKSESRYWSAKFVSFERRKDLKRQHVIPSQNRAFLPSEDFVSLQPESLSDEKNDLNSQETESGETWDEFVMRKTREFNKISRDKPHDENMWIAFANFQDQIVTRQHKKSVLSQALEKKISVLEKALELNPDSEELMLFYLETCKKRDSVSLLTQKWESTLMKHAGSYKLWRGFLRFCQGEFSSFTVSKMRKMYGHALQALSSTCNQHYKKMSENTETKTDCKDLVESERALVDVFVSLCKFEWQTGHRELAIGLFQAEIEYSLFSPMLQLSEPNKQRLFEYFWSNEGERLGEDGALGWGVWLERKEEQRQTAKLLESDPVKTDVGGWTGWSELPTEIGDVLTGEDNANEEMSLTEEDNEDLDAEDSNKEDDMQSLLESLGLNLDPGKEVQVNDPFIWKIWSEEEAKRDREQWMPIRSKAGSMDHDEMESEDDQQLLRVVLFDDIRDYLFSLHCDEARVSLIVQFIDFCGGPINQWNCTNSPSWNEKITCLDSLTDSLLEEMHSIQYALAQKQVYSNVVDLQRLFGTVDSFLETKDHAKFLRNVLLLGSKAFPENYHFKEALLIAEGYVTAEVNSVNCRVTGSRALAKKLLKNNRQDLLLCGVYARVEAAAGNIELARKIFDMALFSLDGLPMDCQTSAPFLYLSYAEAELAHQLSMNANTPNASKQRAIHILSCLGECGKYSSYLSGHVSSTRLLKAHRGFEDQLRHLRSTWARGQINEHSTALVVSAALFEELTSGWEVAARVYDDVFSMVLPGRQYNSLELELLYVRYIQMLKKYKVSVRPAQLWDIILKGLNQYPSNSSMYVSLLEISCQSAFTNKLRCLFNDYCQRKPSAIIWLFALTFELGREGSGPRIHGLFERALAEQDVQQSVILWRCYLAYELYIACNVEAARRVFFRAIHACPWSKLLWLDGFQKLSNILSAKELSDLHDVMRDKELRLRTDIYEILLEDETKL